MWIIKIAIKGDRENHTTFEDKQIAKEFYRWLVKQMSRRIKSFTVEDKTQTVSTTIMKREVIMISFSEIKK